MGLKRVAIVFGGVSPEHEVSLCSAKNVLEVLDRSLFTPIEVGISKDRRWYIGEGAWAEVFRRADPEKFPADLKKIVKKDLPPFKGSVSASGLPEGKLFENIDFAFPLTHGPNGEDGTVQAIFQLLDIPIVGCGVSASAASMNKNYAKAIAAFHGVPVVPSLTLTQADYGNGGDSILASVEKHFPGAFKKIKLFVKPTASGSSFGVSRVESKEQLLPAVELALSYSPGALVEEFIDAREIFVGIIGPEARNKELLVSPPGEVIPSQQVYNYADKYQLGTEVLECPAKLSEQVTAEILRIAKLSYLALECRGFARVDCFYQNGTGKIYLNEINTIPGMTAMSHFPKALGATGLSLTEIVTRLIDCGVRY